MQLRAEAGGEEAAAAGDEQVAGPGPEQATATVGDLAPGASVFAPRCLCLLSRTHFPLAFKASLLGLYGMVAASLEQPLALQNRVRRIGRQHAGFQPRLDGLFGQRSQHHHPC